MTNPLDFCTVNNALLNAGAVNSASEVHGLLCGMYCGMQTHSNDNNASSSALSPQTWQELVTEFTDLKQFSTPDSEDTKNLFEQLRVQTSEQFKLGEFSLTLLLPDDGVSLNRRTQELGEWCQGFLHGLVQSKLDSSHKLSAQSAEGLKDLAQIVQIDNVDDDSEENEKYWYETVEYVKIVVLTIYDELHSQTHDSSSFSQTSDKAITESAVDKKTLH